MGVSGLYDSIKQHFLKKYNLLFNGDFINKHGRISSLTIDMNSIIHPILQEIFSYGDNKSPLITKKDVEKMIKDGEIYKRFFTTFQTKLSGLIEQFKPEQMLVFAVDGVPPEGKIAQQRQRRFSTAIDMSENTIFDSNAVTPGTEFMMELNLKIIDWINANITMYKLPPIFIYSSHLVPGEGEHKILDIYRNEKYNRDLDGAHIIYGNDADLILLSLILPINNVYNARSTDTRVGKDEMRDFGLRAQRGDIKYKNIMSRINAFNENKKELITKYEELIKSLTDQNDINKYSKKLSFIKREKPKIKSIELLDIEELKRAVNLELAHKNNKIDENQIIHDFVAIMNLLGNDFIPGIFAFHNIKTSYNKNNNKIEFMGSFDKILDVYKKENIVLTEQKQYNYRTYNWIGLRKLINYFGYINPELKYKVNKDIHTEETKMLKELYKKINKNDKNLQSFILRDNISDNKLDYRNFRSMWYNNIFKEFISNNNIFNMCKDYLTTLNWIYRYYQSGHTQVSSKWVFKYHHSPLLSDLSDVINLIPQDDLYPVEYNPEDVKVSPITLMLAVFPTSSMALLPPQVRYLMTPDSPIYYLYPEKFELESEGIIKEYQSKVLIPYADIPDIQRSIDSIQELKYKSTIVTESLKSTNRQPTVYISEDTTHESSCQIDLKKKEKPKEKIIVKIDEKLNKKQIKKYRFETNKYKNNNNNFNENIEEKYKIKKFVNYDIKIDNILHNCKWT